MHDIDDAQDFERAYSGFFYFFVLLSSSDSLVYFEGRFKSLFFFFSRSINRLGF